MTIGTVFGTTTRIFSISELKVELAFVLLRLSADSKASVHTPDMQKRLVFDTRHMSIANQVLVSETA